MKVLVCGSRDITDSSVVHAAITQSPWSPDVVMHGNADGVDSIADDYARIHNIRREVHEIPEWVWDKVGRKAGPMRNAYMVDHADAVVAVWDGKSSGTKDAIQQAEGEGLPVYKVICDGANDNWTIVRSEMIDGDQQSLLDFTDE